jgi:hypothetical protein
MFGREMVCVVGFTRTAGSADAASWRAIVDFCNALLQFSAALGRGILCQLRYNSRNWPFP